MFSITPITLLQTPVEQEESLGTRRKFWVRLQDNSLWLLKYPRAGTGEDWSEKIAAELCSLLRLPHADYEFAELDDKRVIMSRSFLTDKIENFYPGEDILGMPKAVSTATRRKYAKEMHTLEATWEQLNVMKLDVPARSSLPSGIKQAVDVFVGYLMLDAWVGNTDRHQQNWGIVYRVTPVGTRFHLAPTFDHASSLGRELTGERIKLLIDHDEELTKYLAKTPSQFFDGSGNRVHTMDIFQNAAALRPKAAKIWLDQLQSVDDRKLRNLIDEVPDKILSENQAKLVYMILSKNMTHLLSLRKGLR